MDELINIGATIKSKRLSLNMRMEDLAKKAGITRTTLWSIEKGYGKCSMSSLFSVTKILGLSLSIDEETMPNTRSRATRINTIYDKRINRFVVLTIEQYASYRNLSSDETYKKMLTNGIINELLVDYEDLHGMSTVYLNDYIDALLKKRDEPLSNTTPYKHMSAKYILITKVSELIAENFHISIAEARDRLYKSKLIKLIDDDETGLYGESPLYAFSIYEREIGSQKD